MPIEVRLRCTCGKVRGVARAVSPNSGVRAVCMCIDCQTYAHAIGRSSDVLDKNGGTEVFQLALGQVEIQEGTEQLRCLRLGPKGAMRWYTECCKTPVGNSAATTKLPLVGIPHLFMDHGPEAGARDRDLGPLLGRVQGQYGHGELPPGTHQKFPRTLLARAMYIVTRAHLLRLARPSPFFDERGQPAVTPRVLSKDERSSFREMCSKTASA
jgi:hypothetical protein